MDFGSDLACVSDIDSSATEVTGNLVLGQAIARRLSTPRGALIDDPNYGFDLTAYLNDDISKADLARIQAGAQAECLKDERVLSAQVTVTAALGSMLVAIVLTTADGPFSLVLAVTDVTVSILKVQS